MRFVYYSYSYSQYHHHSCYFYCYCHYHRHYHCHITITITTIIMTTVIIMCRKELKKSDWRKAYSADTWFSEGGLMPGGRSRKDASWYRSLRKPVWSVLPSIPPSQQCSHDRPISPDRLIVQGIPDGCQHRCTGFAEAEALPSEETCLVSTAFSPPS